MPGWYAETWPTLAGWWWLVPLLCMTLCVLMCLLFRSRMGTGRWSCCMGRRRDDLEEIKREIAGLRDAIGQAGGRTGGDK
ncbi:MAG: hypothetical protein CVU61_10510 [Deltaproteobacteria bacterium HGW-Deltaproteobacteria-19]|jgi:hypothetical protein|nr:MAG: hypothetical protein CVU61_10510 [Deltaproteobacteria bacterium HGW-Deltaproteobacteria-19]